MTDALPASATPPLLELRLLTATEVAAVLACSIRTLRRWARSGHLVPVRVGRTVRYWPDDVRRLIDCDIGQRISGRPRIDQGTVMSDLNDGTQVDGRTQSRDAVVSTA